MDSPLAQIATDSNVLYICKGELFGQEYRFSVHFRDFRKVSAEEIDEPQQITNPAFNEGDIWLLSVAIENLGSNELSTYKVNRHMKIRDQDDCVFSYFNDTHLNCQSVFSKQSGLYRLSGWSSVPPIRPKMQALGAILFLLPKAVDSRYTLQAIEGGFMEPAAS